jgi:hypothetical protein
VRRRRWGGEDECGAVKKEELAQWHVGPTEVLIARIAHLAPHIGENNLKTQSTWRHIGKTHLKNCWGV